jgi:hypothetical protein
MTATARLDDGVTYGLDGRRLWNRMPEVHVEHGIHTHLVFEHPRVVGDPVDTLRP